MAPTIEQDGSSIGWDLFAATVLDMPTAPKLIVLNVRLGPLEHWLASNGAPRCPWPMNVPTEQARQMTSLLYRQLAAGSTIGQAHRETCDTLSPQ